MEEQIIAKKANKGIIVLVVFLVLIIVGLIGYIGFDKFVNKPVDNPTNTNNTNTTKEEKEVDLTAEEIARVTEIAEKLNNGFASYYPITELSVIDNQQLLRLGEEGLFDWNTHNTFTAAQVEANIKKYFGNSVTVKHEGIKCFSSEEEPLFKYDGNGTYSYNDNHLGHGGADTKTAFTFYETGTRKGNAVTANFKVVYRDAPGIGPSSMLYARFNDTTPIYTHPNADTNQLTKEIASQYKAQVPTTTFTFEVSEDGVYSLKIVTLN